MPKLEAADDLCVNLESAFAPDGGESEESPGYGGGWPLIVQLRAVR